MTECSTSKWFLVLKVILQMVILRDMMVQNLPFRCTLEGKRERKGYKELLDDPQLRYSGAYER